MISNDPYLMVWILFHIYHGNVIFQGSSEAVAEVAEAIWKANAGKSEEGSHASFAHSE